MTATYGLLLWIVIGLLAGWLATRFLGTSVSQGPFMDMIVGIAGALLGGYLTQALFGNDFGSPALFASLGAAVFGACALIGGVRLLFSKRAGGNRHAYSAS